MSVMLVIGAVVVGGPFTASAAPLDIAACDRLAQQEAQFVQAGIRDIQLKGPAWAKANASPEKFEQVRLLIQIEEAIQFRCLRTRPLPAASLLAVPPPSTVAAVAVPKAKPKPKPVSATAAGSATGDAHGAGGAATRQDNAAGTAPAPKPKPRPVAKPAAAPDAFVPGSKAQ